MGFRAGFAVVRVQVVDFGGSHVDAIGVEPLAAHIALDPRYQAARLVDGRGNAHGTLVDAHR